jgi:hypothetical protein
MQARFKYSPVAVLCFSLSLLAGYPPIAGAQVPPAPLLEDGKPPVDWWFVFKFNAKSFPACASGAVRACPFDASARTPQDYGQQGSGQPKFSQQFVTANSDRRSLRIGQACVGDTTSDPVGATFDQVYNGSYNYVIWNDQFHRDPTLLCAAHNFGFCESPWAHSKGMLAWDDNGDGFVMQVSTPNWPGAGNKNKPRQTNGNSLGCITEKTGAPQNNVMVSQHFFALKLTKDDVVIVLKALQRASVATARNPAPGSQSQLVKNGGPQDIQDLVQKLGQASDDPEILKKTLSSGVQIIAKPSALHVPPWHMVSALLGQESLVVATWWTGPDRLQDTAAMTPGCWTPSLGSAGPVRNAETGKWNNKTFGLTGAASPDRNHAKLAVSKTGDLAIFGDFNNQGALSPDCDKSQNNRGGLFYVVEDRTLANELRDLMDSRAPRNPNNNAGRNNRDRQVVHR